MHRLQSHDLKWIALYKSIKQALTDMTEKEKICVLFVVYFDLFFNRKNIIVQQTIFIILHKNKSTVLSHLLEMHEKYYI